MQTVQLTGTTRPAVGKKASKAIRNAGGIPCVIYGDKEPLHFSTIHNAVKPLIYSGEFKVAEISIDGATHKCILKEVQFHPVKEDIRHIDFLKLENGKNVILEVPVRFKGSSPGVKLGGSLQQSLRRVKIKTTPENMVDELYGDISTLKLGHAIRVRDLQVPEGIQVMNSPAIPVASIVVPRALRGKDAASGEGEEETAGGQEEEAGGEE